MTDPDAELARAYLWIDILSWLIVFGATALGASWMWGWDREGRRRKR
jgi:hypothetical protein